MCFGGTFKGIEMMGTWICGKCGGYLELTIRHCPYCGAKR